MSIYQTIKEKFDSGEWEGYSQKAIYSALGITSQSEKSAIGRVLSELKSNFDVFFSDGRYYSAEGIGYYKGTLRGNERGFAFFVADDGKISDLFIPNRSLNGALDKDKVIARKVVSDRGSSDEGEVVAICERGVKSLCGTLFSDRGRYFVRPDEKSYFEDIYIPAKRSGGAKPYDKVFADIIRYTESGLIEGEVKEVLGKRFELAAEEKSIVKAYKFKEYFPKAVEAEVAEIPQKVVDNQLIDRLNLTDRLIVTIDGEDSRDFDDAVEVEKKRNGNYLLGVHIADVSEYVKAGSALDKEALKRSNSTYFPDKVIPMLPFELSNGICSLNEGVDRLTLSCIMEIDESGEIVDKKIAKSVIKSKRRMTYTEVQGVLDGDKKYADEPKEIVKLVGLMRELQRILSAKRDKRGSVDLDVKESHITVKDGVIEVEPRKNEVAYKIIEEFMVAANESVAEYAFYLEVPFIYRVHGKPTPEKAEGFVEFIKALGINVRWKSGEVRPSDYSAVLDKIKDEPIFPVVNKIMLRSMQKAKYSPENEGHFGLSSKCYCHFTSPIRRYPDLVVHRVIKMIIDGKIGELIDLYGNFVYEAAKISSENERVSDEAERKVDDLYKAFYMRDKVGEEYDAVISGVTANGVYSELENSVEGFTGIEDLPRGNYTFDPKRYTLYSGKRRFTIGDEVRIGVVGVDIASRKTQFVILADKNANTSANKNTKKKNLRNNH